MALDEFSVDFENRIVEPKEINIDRNENILRPKFLSEYIGQDDIKENLEIYIQASKNRCEPLDHILLYGPPGLGKTTLSTIIANEMNVNIRITSGPAIEKPGDLASILTNLNEYDILFIDEIHRMNRSIEEILYPALEDFVFDIIIGKGPSARSIRIDLPKFTLIGATTRSGQISSPLRDRFGVLLKLNLYSQNDLKNIIKRSANILDVKCTDAGALELSKRSRGTPRIANRILKRARDFADILSDGIIDEKMAKESLMRMGIDDMGLDCTDIRLLKTIINNYNGGPVGIDTLAAAMGEESITLEDMCEPYLMKVGFLVRTPRGRCVTDLCYKYFNINRNGDN